MTTRTALAALALAAAALTGVLTLAVTRGLWPGGLAAGAAAAALVLGYITGRHAEAAIVDDHRRRQLDAWAAEGAVRPGRPAVTFPPRDDR